MARPGRFQFNRRGTRFSVFVHTPGLGFRPEVVYVNAPPGSIAPGPADATLEIIDALNKPSYYSDATFKLRKEPRAPYPPNGPRTSRPAVARGGHFAHLAPGSRAFTAAMTFAVIRLTLEIWGHFFQRRIEWHFARTFAPVLQVHPRVESSNAWSGLGFLEFGFPDWEDDWSEATPFAEILEVVAHETGHLIMKDVIGTMPDDEKSLQHRAHEEAAADLVAMVVALHFESMIAHVLARTGGFLFSDNLLGRVGEWGRRQADVGRNAFNGETLASVRALPSPNKHKMSMPFTGGVFDVFVTLFQERLVAAGALPRRLAAASRHIPGAAMPDLRGDFARAGRGRRTAFAAALRGARDDLARLLARTWARTTKDGLTYGRVVANMLEADRGLGGGHDRLIRDTFALRGIAPAAGRP